MIVRLRVLALAALLCVGCVAPTSAPTPVPKPPTALAASLTTSLTNRDEQAFTANFAPTASAQNLARVWYANLTSLESASFTADADGLALTWSVPGDRTPITQRAPARLGDQDNREVVVDLSRDPAPDWAAIPIAVQTTDSGSVILDANRKFLDGPLLNRALVDAVTTLSATDFGPLDDTWNGRLVLDVARDAHTYAGAGGRPEVDAAVASCAGGAVRIVVNPVAAQFDMDRLGPLILHEGFHAATRACDAAYPRWVVEGLAESVTASAFPQVASDNRDAAVRWLAKHGLPDALPSDDDLAADDAGTLRAVYALAQLAVDATVAEVGRPEAVRLLTSFGQPTTDPADVARVTDWYRAALRALSP